MSGSAASSSSIGLIASRASVSPRAAATDGGDERLDICSPLSLSASSVSGVGVDDGAPGVGVDAEVGDTLQIGKGAPGDGGADPVEAGQ